MEEAAKAEGGTQGGDCHHTGIGRDAASLGRKVKAGMDICIKKKKVMKVLQVWSKEM